MNIIKVGLVTLVATVTLAEAANSQAAPGASNSASAPTISVVQDNPATTPRQCWNDWLRKNDVREGENLRANGDILFVVQASDVVHASLGAKQWVEARNALASQLHLVALNKIATFIGQKVRGSSSVGWLVPDPRVGNDPVKQMLKGISLAERAQKLAGLKLDSEIRKYDPNWDGKEQTDTQKRQIATALSSKFRQALGQTAELLATGATTAVQCEGPAAEDGTPTAGQYEMLLGVVWSPRLAYNAQILANPARTIAPGHDRRSLATRFAAFSKQNPEWLAMTLGNRVWTDENGEMVVVGFGAAPATKIKPLDEGRAQLDAVAAITRYASESIVSSATAKERFDYKVMADGSDASFDQGRYQQQIASATKIITLNGVYKLREWRGKHPISGAPMQVVAYAWKPSSNIAALSARKMLGLQAGIAAQSGQTPDGPIVAPVRAGASGSVADY